MSQYLQCILNDEGKESRGFAGLRLRAEAELYLGLVHYDDMAGNASPGRRPGAIYRLTVCDPMIGAGAMRRSAAWAPKCWAGSTVTQPRGSTSCSPGIGKAGLPDWLHKRCLRGGDHGKRIEGIQASRFI